MPYNGAGNFVSLPPPQYPAVAGDVIRAAYFNAVINDILAGLSNAITRDGQSPPTGNLPMAGKRHTGVADAVAVDQYASYGQLVNGAGSMLFLQSGTGAVNRDLQSRERDWVSVFDFMNAMQIADVRAGTFAQDVTAAMNTAAAAALTLKKALFVPSGGYKMTAPWVIPPEVYVRGESFGMENGYDPGATWLFGAVIFKAHTGNAITKTGPSAYYAGAPIENITISSNRTTYPGGNGIVLDKVSNCHLIRCTAFGIGGDCFVLGVSAGDVTGHNYTFNCYSNNPTGVHYRIRSKWSRHHYPVTDGGTHGMYLDNAPETHVDGFHFEGATVAAVRLANANTSSKFTGKGFINMTNLAGMTGFIVDAVPGNSQITVENVKLLGPSITVSALNFTAALVAATSGTLTAAYAGTTGSYSIVFSDGSVRTATLTNGSTAVSWTGAVTATAAITVMSNAGSKAFDLQGTASNDFTIRNCELQYWDIGVNDNGTSNTRVLDCQMYNIRLPIMANSQNTQYKGNTFSSTVGAYCIDHVGYVGAGGGIWTQNLFDKPLKPTLSGVAGNFGNNQVFDNKGFKTRAMIVTGAVTSPAVIPHGMAGTPQYINFSSYSGAPTNMIVSAVDATNITISWGGGGACQISLQARLVCENQI